MNPSRGCGVSYYVAPSLTKLDVCWSREVQKSLVREYGSMILNGEHQVVKKGGGGGGVHPRPSPLLIVITNIYIYI